MTLGELNTRGAAFLLDGEPLRGPSGEPFIGNIRIYDQDRLAFLLKNQEDFGNVYLFGGNVAFCFDLDLTREILADTRNFGVTQNFLAESVSDPGEEWFAMRRNLHRPLSPSSSDAQITRVSDYVKLGLDGLAWRGRSFTCDISGQAFVAGVAIRSASELLFGQAQPRLELACHKLLSILGRVTGNALALPSVVPTPVRLTIGYRHKAALSEVRRVMDKGEYAPGSACDALVKNLPEDSKGRSSEMLIGAMLAAYRVPAAAMSWCIFYLLQNPEWLAKSYREAEAVGDNEVYLDDIPSIHAVVMESLRLRPPTWLLDRVALRDVVVCNRFSVPRGGTVTMSPFLVQRDIVNFVRPHEFVPERWISKFPGDNNQAFLAFGAGKRTCPGRNAAVRVIAGFLLGILQWSSNISARVDLQSVRVLTQNAQTPEGLSYRVVKR